MPGANVSGTLTSDGTTYNVNAPGYHDHNWGEWNLNGVPWNWAQYSQPEFAFDLAKDMFFQSGQYTIIHTQWGYDPMNNLAAFRQH